VAGINQAESIDDLVLRYLRVTKEMVNGRAATVRLAMADSSWHLLGSIGPDGALRYDYEMLPMDLCLCGTVLSPGDILCRNAARFCSRYCGRRMFEDARVAVVRVPVEHHGELLGEYRIFVESPQGRRS